MSISYWICPAVFDSLAGGTSEMTTGQSSATEINVS